MSHLASLQKSERGYPTLHCIVFLQLCSYKSHKALFMRRDPKNPYSLWSVFRRDPAPFPGSVIMSCFFLNVWLYPFFARPHLFPRYARPHWSANNGSSILDTGSPVLKSATMPPESEEGWDCQESPTGPRLPLLQSCEMSQIWQIYLCKNIERLG